MSTNRTSLAVEATRGIIEASGKEVLDIDRLVANFPAFAEKYKRMEDADRLLDEAIRNEGINPQFHRAAIEHLKQHWPTLWAAIVANQEAHALDPLSSR